MSYVNFHVSIELKVDVEKAITKSDDILQL